MKNQLYPVFLKLDRLRLLIIGAGNVGYEKLFFILKSSPNAQIKVVAPLVNPAILDLLKQGDDFDVNIEQRVFETADIAGADIVIAATNKSDLNKEIYHEAKRLQKIINVADTPELCDFYLGSIVTRGPLKVGISTDGKSPTFAKRLRQVLETSLPENETEELLEQLQELRNRMGSDFATKVAKLNALTKQLVDA